MGCHMVHMLTEPGARCSAHKVRNHGPPCTQAARQRGKMLNTLPSTAECTPLRDLQEPLPALRCDLVHSCAGRACALPGTRGKHAVLLVAFLCLTGLCSVAERGSGRLSWRACPFLLRKARPTQCDKSRIWKGFRKWRSSAPRQAIGKQRLDSGCP